jgi:WXG100 family type VII secretion target
MQGHFRVDPERLAIAAARLEQLAERVQAEGYGIRQSGANLAMAAGNGLAAGAIHGTTGSWASALSDLAAALRRDGETLRSVAQQYLHADEATAAVTRRLIESLGP